MVIDMEDGDEVRGGGGVVHWPLPPVLQVLRRTSDPFFRASINPPYIGYPSVSCQAKP